MGEEANEGLEERIIVEEKCALHSSTKILREREKDVRDIAKGLIKYFHGVEKIRVGYWGFKNGKIAKKLEEGYIKIKPASPDDKINAIVGIEKDKDVKNLCIGKSWIGFDYKNNQIIIEFDYSETKPIFPDDDSF
ncbi:MAG: hypothetical protein AB1393_13425 [Candidatus Edwardsbacteria bacterium]